MLNLGQRAAIRAALIVMTLAAVLPFTIAAVVAPAAAEVPPPQNYAVDGVGSRDPSLAPGGGYLYSGLHGVDDYLVDFEIVPDQVEPDGSDIVALSHTPDGSVLTRYDGHVVEQTVTFASSSLFARFRNRGLDVDPGLDGLWNTADDIVVVFAHADTPDVPQRIWVFDTAFTLLDTADAFDRSSGRNNFGSITFEDIIVDGGDVYVAGFAFDTSPAQSRYVGVVNRFVWDGTALSVDDDYGAPGDYEISPDGIAVVADESFNRPPTFLTAIGLTGDGRLLTAGLIDGSPLDNAFASVLDTNGVAEPVFGGSPRIMWGHEVTDVVRDVQVSGGRAYVLGEADAEGGVPFGTCRINSSGTTTTRETYIYVRSFDFVGGSTYDNAICPATVPTALGRYHADRSELVVEPSGRVIASYRHDFDPGYPSTRLVRLNGNLTYDDTWGDASNAVRVNGEPSGGRAVENQASPLATYPDGRILAGATVPRRNFDQDAMMTRFFANGAPQGSTGGAISFTSSPASVPIEDLPLADTPSFRNQPGNEDLKAAGLGVGGINITPLGLGGINVTPLGLGGINVTGLGVGGINITPLGLGGINVTGLGVGGINITPLGLGGINVTGLGVGGINITPIDQILLSELDPAPATWEELLPTLDRPLQEMSLADLIREFPDVLDVLTIAQIAGDGSALDAITPWELLTTQVKVRDFAPPSEIPDPGDFPEGAVATWEERIALALDAPDATGFPLVDGSGERAFSDMNLLELRLLGVPFNRTFDASLPMQVVPLKQIYFDPTTPDGQEDQKFARLQSDLLLQQPIIQAFLETSALGNVALDTIPVLTDVLDCASGFDCNADLSGTTLFEARHHIRQDARLWQMLDGRGPGIRPSENLDPQALKDADGLTLAEAALAFIDIADSPFSNIRTADLGGYEDAAGAGTYLTYNGPLRGDAEVTVTLPPGATLGTGSGFFEPSTIALSLRSGSDTYGYAAVPYTRDRPANSITFEVADLGAPSDWRLGGRDPYHADSVELNMLMFLQGAFPVGEIVFPSISLSQGDGLSTTITDLSVGHSAPAISGNHAPQDAYPIQTNVLYLPHLSEGERSFFELRGEAGRSFDAGEIVEVFVGDLQVDTDVVIYQSIGAPADAPLRPAPNADPLIPVPAGVRLSESGTPLVGDVRDDIVFEELPVLEVGNERGLDEEIVTVRTTAAGPLLVQVGGYLGHASDFPITLTASARSTAPPAVCPSRLHALLSMDDDPYNGPDEDPMDALGQPRTLPQALPVGTDALVLYPQRRAEDIFGTPATLATLPGGSLSNLVNTHYPTAELIEIDLDPAVRNAYEAWDDNPCSIAHANAVVRAINELVDRLRATLPSGDITSVTLVGDHDLVPFALVQDSTQQHNESSYGAGLRELAVTNPLRAAYLAGYIPTHAGYADLEPEPYLDRYLYVSDLAVGRLVETPENWDTTIANFGDFNGQLAIETGVTAGYDFLADSSTAIADLVDAQAGSAQPRLIDGWTADDLKAQLEREPAPLSNVPQAPDLVILNAHADSDEIGPDLGTDRITAGYLATLDFGGSIVHSMGCHTAVSVSDVTIGSTALDFSEALLEAGAASFAGQTTYGLGLEGTIGLTEALMLDYQDQLSRQASVGEAFAAAQQAARGRLGAFGVFDEKAIVGANFFGLPMWKVGGLQPVDDPPVVEPIDDLSSVSIRPAFTLVQNTDGAYYEAVDTEYATEIDDHGDLLVTVGRPILPSLTLPIADNAKGALVWDYSPIDEEGFDPDYSELVVDSSQVEAVGDSNATVVFPNQPVAVSGNNLAAVVGAFITTDSVTGTGTMRRFAEMDVRVFHGTDADVRRPVVSFVDAIVDGQSATFEVRATDASGVDQIVILIEDPALTQVQRLVIDPADPHAGTFAASYATTSETLRYSVQVKDGAGNVRALWNKGALFNAVIPPPPPEPAEINVTVTTTAIDDSEGWVQEAVVSFDHPATVTLSYRLATATGSTNPVPYSGPIVIDGPDGPVDVRWTSSDGQSGIESVFIDTTPPTTTVTAPAGTYEEDEVVLADFACDDNIEVVRCELTDEAGDRIYPGDEIDTSPGEHVVTATATDTAGFVTTQTITYEVGTPPPPVGVTVQTTAIDDSNGWIQSATVTFDVPEGVTLDYTITSTDGSSGPFAYSSPVTIDSPDGPIDLTWNASSGESGTLSFQIDSTPPTTVVTSPTGSYVQGDVVTADYACDDNVEVVSCQMTDGQGQPISNGDPIDTSSTGTYTVSVTATDTAGLTTTTDHTYEVSSAPYAFDGFRSPVRMAGPGEEPVVNVVKAGRNIPMKWELRDHTGAYVRSLDVVEQVAIPQTACDGLDEHELDLPDLLPLSGLFYDYAHEEYHYNWKTQKSFAGECRAFALSLDDGSRYFAFFRFR